MDGSDTIARARDSRCDTNDRGRAGSLLCQGVLYCAAVRAAETAPGALTQTVSGRGSRGGRWGRRPLLGQRSTIQDAPFSSVQARSSPSLGALPWEKSCIRPWCPVLIAGYNDVMEAFYLVVTNPHNIFSYSSECVLSFRNQWKHHPPNI